MTDSGPATLSSRRPVPTSLLVLAIAGALLGGAAFAIKPIMGIGLLVGLIYAFVVLERPIIGVYTCYALVPITAGVRRGLPVPGAKLDEALVLGTFILVAGLAGLTRRWGLIDSTLAMFALVAFILPIGTGVLLGTPMTSFGIQKMGASILFLLLFRLVRVAGLTGPQRWFALKLLFAGTIPVVLVALGQRFDLPGVRDGVRSITDGDVFLRWSYVNGAAGSRATGLFENWHSLAGYLFPLLLVAVALIGQKGISTSWKKSATVLVGVTLVGIVAAQTITTLAVAVAAAILVGAMQRRFARTVSAIVFVVVAAVIVSGGALTERVATQFEGSGVGQNIETRLDVWTVDYAEPLQKYWATGYGPEIPPEITWQHTESLYVTLILRGGVLLLAAYFILMFVVSKVAWEGRKSPIPLDRALSIAVFAAAVGSLAMHLVFPYFTASGFPQVFWLLAGLLPARGAIVAWSSEHVTPDRQELVSGRR